MDLSEERFEELAADALDALPQWVLDRMENVDVVIAASPPRDQPGLLGLYEGIPLTERGSSYGGVLPDRITLYRSTLIRGARTETEIRVRVRQTVVHEVAHHFGISDERLHELDRY